MTKNTILISSLSLDANASDNIPNQDFLETLIEKKYPEFRTQRVDGPIGIGDYLSGSVPVRFDKSPPTSIEDLHTLGEKSILNDVKAIVFPINKDGSMYRETGLYTLPNINHVSSLLKAQVDAEKHMGSWHVASYHGQKSFSRIFDIPYYFSVGNFIPNQKNLDGPKLINYSESSPMLPEQNNFAWMPVVKKAYEVWLNTLK